MVVRRIDLERLPTDQTALRGETISVTLWPDLTITIASAGDQPGTPLNVLLWLSAPGEPAPIGIAIDSPAVIDRLVASLITARNQIWPEVPVKGPP